MEFKQLGLNKHILKAIAEQNYNQPTEVQIQTIPQVLNKKDLIVKAQTGTGKTAAFALPIAQMLFDKQEASKKGKVIRALIITPTRELAQQVFENFNNYIKYSKLKTAVVVGGLSISEQEKILKKGVDILIATPGRLLDLNKQNIVNLSKVETLVLDEADLMLDMGFIDEVSKINNLCPFKKQTLLFSATMPNKVVELSHSILVKPTEIKISTSVLSQSINQQLMYVPIKEKNNLLLHLLKNDLLEEIQKGRGNILIFRRTKYGVEKLEKLLSDNKFNVETIHGNKTQLARQDALNRFKTHQSNILIATDIAARGIDIDNIDVVINFDFPKIPETYVHRIGRTGRAGETGKAISFCCAEEKEMLKQTQSLLKETIPVNTNHPFELPVDAKPQIHRKKSGSKYRKGRKSEASKKKKKRWY